MAEPRRANWKGLTKASDIFSFGLLVCKPCLNSRVHVNLCLQCIFALGGRDFLLINDYQELVKSWITPEQ